MPTVLRFGGLRVVIYPNDHRPAHVHIKSATGEAVFVLRCPDGPPILRENFGFNGPELTRMELDIAGALGTLCAQWRAMHGRY